MAAGQQLDALPARREIAVRAGEQTVVVLLAEGMLQASQRARQSAASGQSSPMVFIVFKPRPRAKALGT